MRLDNTREQLGEIIRLRRMARNLSGRELAALAGMCDRSLYNWERGGVPYIIESFIKVCAVLDMGEMFSCYTKSTGDSAQSTHGPQEDTRESGENLQPENREPPTRQQA